MAKYDVKMSCGHTETIQLFGKMTDREKRIAWLEEHGTCSACYKARQAAAHAEETAAAKAKAEADNLPNLTGSEKQINWALAIRAKKLEALDTRLAEMNAKVTDEQQQRKNQIACKAMRNVLASKTESKFWIDNRNTETMRLIANNNLQDELKAEFARLTAAEADAENNNTNDKLIAAIDDYATTAEAFDEAVNAEIEAAANNEEEPKMKKITTKAAKNGATIYYADGKRISRDEANEEIAQWWIDQLKENIEDLGNQYWQLRDELDAAKAEPDDDNDDDPDNDAPTDNKPPTPTKKISYSQFTDLMAWAEKISNGQHDASIQIKTHLKLWLNVDVDQISIIKHARELNDFRVFLAQFNLVIKDGAGYLYKLFVSDTGECVLGDADFIPPTNDTPTRDEQAAHIANQYKQMSEFADKLIRIEYLTNSQVNSILVAIYADNANAEQVKRLVDKFKADNDRYIDACAKTIKNILDAEEKRAELENTNVFDLLPSVDELNDVDDEPTAAPLTEELRFTPYGNVRQRLFIGDEKIRFFDDEFLDLWSGKYRVGVHQLSRNNVHVAVNDEDGGSHWEEFDMDNLSEEFWNIMADRGACSFDEPVDEPPTIDDGITPELIVGTKITARDSVAIKIDGKRASRATAEDKIYERGDFTVINEFGKVFDGYVTRDGALRILRPEGNSLRFANVDAMVNHLAFDNIFHDEPEPPTEEPTEDVPDTIAAVAETLHDINDHAPDGWEVFYNADGKNYTVTFDDEPIANLDSLALLKVLPPEEFFDKFKSTANEQFSADRVDEVAALKEMRKQLAGDKERLKIIDDLINDATRAAILG